MRFILYYPRNRLHSLNVLAGALETEPRLGDMDIRFCRGEETFHAEMESSAKENIPSVIGCSLFSVEFAKYSRLITGCKQKYPDHPFLYIAGGPHATAEPEDTLQGGFDLAFIGEAEKTLVDFFLCLREDRDYRFLKGLAWMEGNQFHHSGRPDPVNLDHYPFYCTRYRKLNPIEITRGCIYACKYCQSAYLHKANFRHRSVENICELLKTMKTKGRVDVRFSTPSALSYGSNNPQVRLERVEQLLSSIREVVQEKGRIYFGTFPSEIRPEHITSESLRLIKKYCNNDNLIIGAQSGSQKILDLCHRGHTVEDVRRAVRLSREAGFGVNVDIIFGLPGETDQDARLTLKLMDELISWGAWIHSHYFMPLPGTPYQNASSAELSDETLQLIREAEHTGKFYGHWKKQVQLSEHLEIKQKSKASLG